MSDAWFDRHVYEVAVHKKHLRGLWKGKPTDKAWRTVWQTYTKKSIYIMT